HRQPPARASGRADPHPAGRRRRRPRPHAEHDRVHPARPAHTGPVTPSHQPSAEGKKDMSENRNLSDIVEIVADATGLEVKDARRAVTATLYAIQHEVAAGNRVKFVNFGTFTLAHKE